MNTQKIIKELQQKYPGKKIILNPQDNPTEIICEISPTSDHPEKSIALAIVGSSKPHYHKNTTEIYEAQNGMLTVYVNGKKYMLKVEKKSLLKKTLFIMSKVMRCGF